MATGGAAVLVASLLGGCGGPTGPSAQSTLGTFLSAWSAKQWTVMSQMVDRPPADFVTVNTSAFKDLGVTAATFTPGVTKASGGTASTPVTEHLTLGSLGVWSPTTTVSMVKLNGKWRVEWNTTTINPALTTGLHFGLTRTWAARASILGAGNTPLETQAGQVNVGIEGSRVKNPTQLTSVLVAAGATAAEVTSALTAAKAHPTYFEQVFQMSEGRYQQLGGVTSALYQVPGTVFQHTSGRVAITTGLSAHVVGSVGPITAQELAQLGPTYNSSDEVGQSGIEQAYEQRLAGTPGGSVILVNAAGTTTSTVQTFLPHPGKPVVTTINATVQAAAEAALSGVPGNSALVVVQPSTGEVLASVSDPTSLAYDQALDGRFPPGSTFKIIDSTGLFEAGLTPSSPASCPSTLTVNGQVFHNAEGDGVATTVLQAFEESCNTAFIGLVDNHLSTTTLTAAANLYNVGATPKIGLSAATGSVPIAAGANGLAATAIGQGQVLVSPLNMAMVAASVESGTVHLPRLVVGAPDDSAPSHPLPAAVVPELQSMMAGVVASGTAAGTGLPAATHAKTGTAEYGTGTPAAHRRLAGRLRRQPGVRHRGAGHRQRRADRRADHRQVPQVARLGCLTAGSPRGGGASGGWGLGAAAARAGGACDPCGWLRGVRSCDDKRPGEARSVLRTRRPDATCSTQARPDHDELSAGRRQGSRSQDSGLAPALPVIGVDPSPGGQGPVEQSQRGGGRPVVGTSVQMTGVAVPGLFQGGPVAGGQIDQFLGGRLPVGARVAQRGGPLSERVDRRELGAGGGGFGHQILWAGWQAGPSVDAQVARRVGGPPGKVPTRFAGIFHGRPGSGGIGGPLATVGKGVGKAVPLALVALLVAGCAGTGSTGNGSSGTGTAAPSSSSAPAPGSSSAPAPGSSSASAPAVAATPSTAASTTPASAPAAPTAPSSGTAALGLVVEPDAGIGPIDALLARPRHSLDMVMYELVDPTAEQILATDAARGGDRARPARRPPGEAVEHPGLPVPQRPRGPRRMGTDDLLGDTRESGGHRRRPTGRRGGDHVAQPDQPLLRHHPGFRGHRPRPGGRQRGRVGVRRQLRRAGPQLRASGLGPGLVTGDRRPPWSPS